jgi:hypothetical protein
VLGEVGITGFPVPLAVQRHPDRAGHLDLLVGPSSCFALVSPAYARAVSAIALFAEAASWKQPGEARRGG